MNKPAPALPGSGPQPSDESALAAALDSLRGQAAPSSARPPGWRPVFERVLAMIIESRGGKIPEHDAEEVIRTADRFAVHILANWPAYGAGLQ